MRWRTTMFSQRFLRAVADALAMAAPSIPSNGINTTYPTKAKAAHTVLTRAPALWWPVRLSSHPTGPALTLAATAIRPLHTKGSP